MSTLVLTKRDMDLLAFLALHREYDMALLAETFFYRDPVSDWPNMRPAKACARRIARLRAHGYLDVRRVKDGRRTRSVAYIAPRADQPLDDRASRRTLHRKARVHHLKTLDALRALEKDITQRGGRVVRVETEHTLRANAQRGRRTRRGDSFSSFPDAVCIAVVPTAAGAREVRIAVEYVTGKYTSADIREKRDSFRTNYDDAVWFADKARTVKRVKSITGAPCSILT